MGDLIVWIFVILFVLGLIAVVIEFFVKFWWILLIIWVILYFWAKHHKQVTTQTNTVSSEITQKASSQVQVQKPTKPKNESNYFPKKIDYQEVLGYLNSLPFPMLLEDGKTINPRNGKPMPKQQVIEQVTRKIKRCINNQRPAFSHFISLSGYDRVEAARQYLLSVASPYYEGAMLAYKCCDWTLAERWWLSIIDLLPYESSKRLAILYRKQHRYKDVSDMYAVAINDSKKPYIHLRPGQDQKMVSAFMKASEKYLAKKDKDKSKGVKTYPSIVDMKFIDVLNGNETYPKQKELIGDN